MNKASPTRKRSKAPAPIAADATGGLPAKAPEMSGGGEPDPYPLAPFQMMDAASLDVRMTGARIETQSLIFDPHWYLWRYRDVEAAGLDPVQHYFLDGAREGRDPNRYFSTAWYAQANPDVAASGSNPFLHYVLYGAREGRKPRP